MNKLDLYKYGTVSEGIITDMRPVISHGKNKYQPYVLVDYYFKSTVGQKVTGRSTTHDMAILTTKKNGDTIKIFVSGDESKSCLVPLDEAEKNGWSV